MWSCTEPPKSWKWISEETLKYGNQFLVRSIKDDLVDSCCSFTCWIVRFTNWFFYSLFLLLFRIRNIHEPKNFFCEISTERLFWGKNSAAVSDQILTLNMKYKTMIFFPFPSMSNSHWQIWSGRDCKRIGASGKTTSKQLHDPKLPFLCRQEVSLSPAYLWKRPLPPRFAACHREKEKIYRYSSMATYTILRADEVVKLYFRSGHLFLKFLSEVFFF